MAEPYDPWPLGEKEPRRPGRSRRTVNRSGRGPSPATHNRRTVIIVAVVAVLAILGFLTFRTSDSLATIAIGECVQVEAGDDVQQIGCADPSAVYVVEASGDGDLACDPSESFAYLYLENQSQRTNMVCLWPNLEVGDCWQPGVTQEDPPVRFPRCEGVPDGSDPLTVLLEDRRSADAAQCPEETVNFLTNSSRHRLICFGTHTP